MKLTLPVVIALLALVGLGDSVYLSLAHFGVVSPTSMESSGVCSLAARSCANIITSPQASVAGVPHAVLGALYFALVSAAAVYRVVSGRWFAPLETLALLVFGLGWSIFLTQELLLRIYVPCPFCLTAHGLNVIIVLLFAISIQQQTLNSAALALVDRVRLQVG